MHQIRFRTVWQNKNTSSGVRYFIYNKKVRFSPVQSGQLEEELFRAAKFFFVSRE